MEKHINAGLNEKDFKENLIYIVMSCLDIDFIRVMVNAEKDYGYYYYSYTVRRPQIQICVTKKNSITDNVLYKTSMEVKNG